MTIFKESAIFATLNKQPSLRGNAVNTTEKFNPFFFDGDRFFREVRDIPDWLELCKAYRDYFSRKCEMENRRQLMSRAKATLTTEYVEERGISFPKWHRFPNFGLRREHIGQNLTLEVWLKNKIMYDFLLKAK